MNDNRFRLGILFNFNPKWMGGIIYIINLIKALNYLKDEDKPIIFLFYRPDLKKFLDEFQYPYLNLIEWESPKVVTGNLKSWILRKNIFYDRLVNNYKLDALYPAKNYPVRSKTNAKIVAWYPDLQHKYYPEFFSRLTILHRNIRLHLMLKNAQDLIVSSEAVKSDFYKFYRPRKDLRFHIYHFVSINNDYQTNNFKILSDKYQLPEKFFMIANQFHKHKNHKVLIESLAKLRNKGVVKYLVFTGKFPEDSNSPHIIELNNLIREKELMDQVKFLGIIPRNEQVQIMKRAQAIIQPSLFEGWSTVIEDAISLQIPVIASNIPVNIEQLKDKGTYFKPHDADELANIMQEFPDRKTGKNIYGDYSLRIQKSAEKLMNVFQ